jgi:hypothetical protein
MATYYEVDFNFLKLFNKVWCGPTMPSLRKMSEKSNGVTNHPTTITLSVMFQVGWG